MIGLMIIAVLFIYILISLFIVIGIYKYFHTKKSIAITIIIMLLIPTWDIVLGYPIYKFLCWKDAGVHVYKTVDNVEGFYVGEDIGTYSKIPPLPYKGYRFIDYKKRKKSNEPYKYYRVSWIDANTTKNCIKIGNASSKYDLNLYKHGKCIVKKEIPEKEVSRWEYVEKSKTINKLFIIDLRLDSIVSIKDRKNKNLLSEVVSVVWKGGWLYGFLSSIPVGNSWKVRCPKIIEIKFNEYIYKTLKPKKGEK